MPPSLYLQILFLFFHIFSSVLEGTFHSSVEMAVLHFYAKAVTLSQKKMQCMYYPTS